MYCSLKATIAKYVSFVALSLGLLTAAGVSSASAQGGAFVQQMQVRVLHGAENLLTSLSHNGPPGANSFAPAATLAPTVNPAQQLANPAVGNFAASFASGVGNHILQMQSGKGNYSAAAIVGGRKNNVGVLQEGNDLFSQIVLANTSGLNVGVIQPPNSAPVNVFIARLPNGGLLIKR